jgi:hypothetical protein
MKKYYDSKPVALPTFCFASWPSQKLIRKNSVICIEYAKLMRSLFDIQRTESIFFEVNLTLTIQTLPFKQTAPIAPKLNNKTEAMQQR